MKEVYIEDLEQFEKYLKGDNNFFNGSIQNSPVIVVNDTDNYILLDGTKIFYRKVPELATPRYLFALKLLLAMNNKYLPIFNFQKELLFTEEEFLSLRKKKGGIKEYDAGNFSLSNNLEFSGLDTYLSKIDENRERIDNNRKPIIEEFTKIMNSISLSTSIGNNSGGDVELVEAGSTMRGTNIPTVDASLDFDFTVRIDPDKVWLVKNALESKFQASGHITQTARYKVRLLGVKIPGLDALIDLDFSLTPQKKKYLATEDAICEQLDNIKMQSTEKYNLVLANIMYAKDFLKHAGAYKPSRGILDSDRSFGGIGGVGIENWILQNGGSFIDAARNFLEHAENKEFIDFEKEYAIMDFGKNHVEVSKGNFPYDNFVMKNMRYNGFELMKNSLKTFLDSLDLQENKTR